MIDILLNKYALFNDIKVRIFCHKIAYVPSKIITHAVKRIYLKERKVGAEERAQQLRALTALTQDLDSVLNFHVMVQNSP